MASVDGNTTSSLKKSEAVLKVDNYFSWRLLLIIAVNGTITEHESLTFSALIILCTPTVYCAVIKAFLKVWKRNS